MKVGDYVEICNLYLVNLIDLPTRRLLNAKRYVKVTIALVPWAGAAAFPLRAAAASLATAAFLSAASASLPV